MNEHENRLRVALVGCGQIADAHLQEINKIGCARAVAVCDRHLDLARQAAARFGVRGVYADLGQMLEQERPDVIHVTTPPRSHAPIALQALAAGSHVYVEKPFTVDVGEADVVLRAAEASGRLVCVGHNLQFDPAWQACRDLYRRGDLGQIVHVESIMGYNLAGPFGKVLSSEDDHWVHGLPGGLFHNTMSHAVYRVTDFLRDERPQVWAHWFGRGAGGGRPTELRVMVLGAETTASIVFSSAARPVLGLGRVYGTKQSVEVDLDGRILRRYQPITLPGPFGKIQVPARHFGEAARSLWCSLWRFALSDLQFFAGMNRLFTEFYQAIREKTAPPIPYEEIRRVTWLMDEIFRRCRQRAIEHEGALPVEGVAANRPATKSAPSAHQSSMSTTAARSLS